MVQVFPCEFYEISKKPLLQNTSGRLLLNNMTLIKSFWRGVLYDRFKVIYAYLSEQDKLSKCYSCLKMIIQVHLHVGFFKIFFIKRASLKWFYLCIKLLQSSTIFKQKKVIMKCFAIKIFAWTFLQLPIQKT